MGLSMRKKNELAKLLLGGLFSRKLPPLPPAKAFYKA
jgi:hypothetical protein